MAMLIGSVVVLDDGTTSTKTGLAGELYDAAIAVESPTWPNPASPPSGVTIPSSTWSTLASSGIVGLKKDYARDANAIALAVIAHITTNALVDLGTGRVS
jgi:hypothetical protein